MIWDNGKTQLLIMHINSLLIYLIGFGRGTFDRVKRVWTDPALNDIVINGAKGIPNTIPHVGCLLQCNFQAILTINCVKNGNVTTWLKANSSIGPASSYYYLNGNTIQAVLGPNKKALPSGQVTITGNVVTLSPTYLNSLPQKFGDLGAGLTVKSNRGAEIPIEIRRYTVPVISKTNFTSPAIGTDLVIPTNFNGAKLATTRALKADGTFLKDDWTV